MNRSQIILAGGAIALVLGSTAALSHPKSDPLASAPIQSAAMLPSQVPFPASTLPLPAVSPTPMPSVVPDYSRYQVQRIVTCAGRPSSANFRAFPSLAASAILGVVASGESVYLTGRTASNDGVRWQEAIAPALFPVPSPGTQTRLAPNQVGWLASCFVGG